MRKTIVRMCGGILAYGVLGFAQTTQFEVASVKPAPPDARGMRCTGGPGTSDPGSLRCENYSLSFLVMMAYDLRSFQLTAPAWMNATRYNVAAKIPPGCDRRQFGLMQQRLLAERFGLRVRFEKKDMTVYELTVARGGPKLKESQDSAAEKPEAAWKPPAFGPPVRTMASVDRKGESIADLANFLSNQLGQPVKDATGLGGRYDYALSFLMEPGGRAAGPVASDVPEPEFGISLIDAVRDQLGLSLEKKKGQTDVVVVDRAEKVPIENLLGPRTDLKRSGALRGLCHVLTDARNVWNPRTSLSDNETHPAFEKEQIPDPSHLKRGRRLVAVPLWLAPKLALYPGRPAAWIHGCAADVRPSTRTRDGGDSDRAGAPRKTHDHRRARRGLTSAAAPHSSRVFSSSRPYHHSEPNQAATQTRTTTG